MRTLIIGYGEVGRAHARLLAPHYDVEVYDIVGRYAEPKGTFDIMHICIRHDENFIQTVREYMGRYLPGIVNVCTTVPPGTCEQLGENVVHSTTRGLHPNLEVGLLNIRKHVGGPCAQEVSDYFEKAGIKCLTHARARETEVAHLLNNAAYGVNLVLADEMAKICREHGVDYLPSVMMYTQTHNTGYTALGHASKVRSILTPPGGRIGGHCVAMSAGMISMGGETPLIERVARYNDK